MPIFDGDIITTTDGQIAIKTLSSEGTGEQIRAVEPGEQVIVRKTDGTSVFVDLGPPERSLKGVEQGAYVSVPAEAPKPTLVPVRETEIAVLDDGTRVVVDSEVTLVFPS